MRFIDWIYSSYPNPHIDGQWGWLHITTLIICVGFIVASTLLLRKKSNKAKRIVFYVIAGILIFFELSRRIINLCKTADYGFNNILKILLPRPGCAISVWLVILAIFINKKFFYNFASIIGILSGMIFFMYPGVGFNNQFILFENLYSIVTHAVFFTASICFITYKFTDFNYKTAWKELICIGVLLVYVFLEIYALKIESDPFYFMPENDVQDITDLPYGAYLPLYIVFVTLFYNTFYIINLIKNKRNTRKKSP